MVEQVIKKSRFITHLFHAPGIEVAKTLVQQVKQQHPDAGHNCWAFVAGSPDNSMMLGFSDDGEPSGTAGRPMLAQLQGSGVGEICAVVSRYFGGIKLGTGGLVKAYGSSVQQALSALECAQKVARSYISFDYDYSLQGSIDYLFEQYAADIIAQEFQQQARVTVAIDASRVTAFCKQLENVSKGLIHIPEQAIKNQP